MKVEEVITNRIIEQLEKGTVPWHQPWNGSENEPKNIMSQKEYHGINAFLTACQGFSSPYWLTYKQAVELGGNIRKGENGTPVIFWNWKEKENEKGEKEKVPFMRYYTVFNLAQCEGLDPEYLNKWIIPPGEEKKIDKIEQCEKVVDAMPNRPELNYNGGKAYYQPSTDKVTVPDINQFHSSEVLFYLIP
jgi:antirestriction protein ArdC